MCALVLAVGIVGLVHEGVPAAEVELNDGGVWVTNGKMGLVGHLNYESRMLDGGVRSDVPRLDVSQFGSSVVVLGAESVQQLSPASVAFASEAAVPGIEVAHGGEKVLFTDPAAGAAGEGKVWVGSLEQLSFRPESEPLLEDLDAPRGVVGVDGDAFVVTADGTVREITGVGEDAVDTEVGTLGALANEVDLTVVGSTLVVLDGDVVRTLDRATEIPGLGEHAVLQQPSLWQSRERTPEVLVASSDGLWRVPLNGDEPSQEEVPAGGEPARPAVLGDCAYGLWKGTGHYLRHCADETLNVGREFSELAEATDPRFRVNRRSIVINDLADGAVYLPVGDAMIRVDDWERVSRDLDKNEQESEETEETTESQLQEFSETQTAPEAQDDEFGARVGRSTTLPVLLNDFDADGDVLTAVITSQPEVEGVEVTLGKDGRAVRATVAKDTTARPFSFRYKAFDGTDFSNEATVTVGVVQKETNRAPVKKRNVPVRVAAWGSAEYSVLPDWVDPDGDPLFLVDASSDDGLRVTWRPDGYISVQDGGSKGPGRRSVSVTVSDGPVGEEAKSTEGELTVLVSSSGSNPPVANNDHFVANVGETVTLRPLSNDTDPEGDALRLVGVGPTEPGVEAKADPVENTVAFTASKAGTQTLVYSVTDGPNKSKGRIRVDVVDPVEVTDAPAAEDDLVLMGPSGVVVVEPLLNDFDPAGGVLVIQSASTGSTEGLTVEVVDHALLRVSAPTGITKPTSFEYTVSNGTAPATASVLVVPLAAQAEIQSPVAMADTAVVRAGDIVTVDVLANDYSPSDLPISVRPFAEAPSTQLGEFFISGDQVRFRAGEQAGTAEAVYTIADSQGNVASTSVEISVKEFDQSNQPPSPGPVTARTFSGATILIPIPMDGIDPDGDSVELVGTGAMSPKRGSVTVEGNYLKYSAAVGDAGTDVFSYRVMDRFGGASDGVVRVGIAPAPTENQAPVAVPDEIVTRPGRTMEIPVTDNDFDPDGDKITLVDGTVEAVDDSWVPEFTIEGQKIALTAPAEVGVYQLYYGIVDKAGQAKGGVPVVGVVTVIVDEDVEPVAPVAVDDYVSATSIAGVESVPVPVLENDHDPDGTPQDLVVELEESAVAKGGTVTTSGVVTVPVEDERQVLLYTITDGDDLTARAAVIVPGRAQVPPMLNPAVEIPATVKAGDTLSIDLAAYVRVRDGHTAKLTAVDSVVAGPGGNTEDPALGLKVVDDTTITFTPDKAFHGATSVSFEVTDGDTIEDPRGLRATVSLPIAVEAAGRPPALRPSEVKVAPGEPPLTVSLASMVDDPDPGDNEAMTYGRVSASSGIDAAVDGQNLAVSVAADTPAGTRGTIVVSVDDGDTKQEMTIPVTVVESNRPLMSVTDITDNEGRVDKPTSFDLSRYVTNPFADQGKPITLVGEPRVTAGAATATANGLTITVTPKATGGAGDSAADVVVSYTVADATGNTSRNRTGTIRMTVKDTPMAPTDVVARTLGSKTARVSWTHAGWRGGQRDGFTVFWNGGSKDCGGQTSCDINTLANGNNYTFTVKARVKESDIADSVESTASNSILVDAIPNTPAAPKATFGDRKIDLTWAPTTVPDGGSPVTKYIVEVTPGGTQRSTSGTSMIWDGLTNGVAYTFTITAHNKLTESDPVNNKPPKGPDSTPETPAGPPSDQGAPVANKDKAAAGVAPRVNLTWSPPGNPNGDTNLTYQVRQRGSGTLLYEGTSTSTAVTMTVGEEDKTFEVQSTNKSKVWSGWSPASNAVRAFQPPGAPTGFTLTATGDGTRARFNFGAAAGNGARSGEISYRWRANGSSGTVTPGETINSGAFTLGTPVTVELTAISTVNGETSEGGTATATVTAYGPPAPPTVTAKRAANGNVDLSWSSPATSGGLTITGVEVFVNGTSIGSQPATGTVQRGNGPNQTFTITARAINNKGDTSGNSQQNTATTRGEGSYRTGIGGSSECHAEITKWHLPPMPDCKDVTVELSDWYPNTTVTCHGYSFKYTVVREYAIDVRGSGGGVYSSGAYVEGSNPSGIENCRYTQ